MILDEQIEIVVNNQNLDYYRKLGYHAEYRKKLLVKPMDLNVVSHYKLNVCCDICLEKNVVEFRQLNGVDKYSCRKCAARNRKKPNKRTEEEKVIINEKTKKTKLEKYGNENYQNIDKIKVTKLEKYGNPHFNNIEKTRKTKKEKYGNENFNNQVKKNETLRIKYGNENYNNPEKRKDTLIKLYGDPHFNNQPKKEETCLLTYGVRHTNQVPDIMTKINISSYKTKLHELGLNYQGSYELDFLDMCLIENIKIEKFVGNIEYINEGKKHKYYPDFYHRQTNTIIEIKSKYTFEIDLKVNNLKKEASIKSGYNFLFIIDKNYQDLIKKIV